MNCSIQVETFEKDFCMVLIENLNNNCAQIELSASHVEVSETKEKTSKYKNLKLEKIDTNISINVFQEINLKKNVRFKSCR